jgi:hypothetical protein
VLGVHHWPELFGAKTDRLRSIFLGDPQTPDSGIVELAALAFADGVRRITVAAPAGKTVPMAVITAPDGVLVELIGPAQ